MIDFVGRAAELTKIQDFLKSPDSGISVIFGRRRIGKTELVRKALSNKRYLSFEGLENRPKAEQLDAFLLQLTQQTGEDYASRRSAVKNWRDAFSLLIPLVKKEGYHLFFDEFQWMANYRSEIVSDLKLIWDQYLGTTGDTKLILCGSIASYMTGKILQSNALYGRISLVIHLKAFCLAETREILGGDRSLNEVLDAHHMVGGVPQYLEILKDKSSVRLGMEEEAFTRFGYFTEEYGRIFLSHFGSNQVYEKIVKTLAKHPYGLVRKQITKAVAISGGGTLTRQLEDLESAGFISSQTPFHRPDNSPERKYFLSDPYLRFYSTFISSQLKQINGGQQQGTLFARICDTGKFYSWQGRAFENLCFEHSNWFADELKFSAVDYTFGPWFEPRTSRSKGFQIDMVYNRADNVLTVCEAKLQNKPVGMEIIKEMDKKTEALRQKFPDKTIQKILIAPNGCSKPLNDSRYFFRILGKDALMALSGV